MRGQSNGRWVETCYKRSMGRPWVSRGNKSRASLAAFCVALASAACGAPQRGGPQATGAQLATASAASDGGEIFSFPELIASPHEVSRVSEGLQPFFAQCKLGDAALSRVAERFARRRSEGAPALDVSEISFALRAEGSPYVWPRAWTLEGGDLQSAATIARMRSWLESFGDGGERRCGLALAEANERSVLAAVAVDALADLEPLAIRIRAGTWVDFKAHMLVPATDARLIVAGPSGAPHAVPTHLDGQRVRARFRADRPGPFVVQLLADVAGGPRPVLEAALYADHAPPTSFLGEPAPGEPGGASAGGDLGSALLSMVNGARASEGSPAVLRVAALDAIAQQHAEAMLKAGRVAHDVGDGLPTARVEAAALSVLAAGENVAHALDLARAHRALWASPAHRENLLQPRFDRVGIGIAADPDGSIWVCELFADFPDHP
jgi:uncharacterized protein YkwD